MHSWVVQETEIFWKILGFLTKLNFDMNRTTSGKQPPTLDMLGRCLQEVWLYVILLPCLFIYIVQNLCQNTWRAFLVSGKGFVRVLENLEALKYYSGILEKVTGPKKFWKSVTSKLK